MITKEQYEEYREKTLNALADAGIALTEAEKENVEVADFGLERLPEVGLQVITYVNTPRCCAKELVLTPWQICPEHRHPPVDGRPGKEETFRCRKGVAYVYVGGFEDSAEKKEIMGRIPQDMEPYFTVYHQLVLHPGEQYTLPPDTLHWFQAGEEGCIVSEFSTNSRDDLDIFTDPHIDRTPRVDE